MTKGKESQVPRRQGCSRSSASWTLYSMGPVSMDSILAKVSALIVSSGVSRVSEGGLSSGRSDLLDQVREAPGSCADAVAPADPDLSDGPAASAVSVTPTESGEAADGSS